MFGADNCRASVAHPGAQLAIAGGLAPRSAYQSAHLGPAGVENFHYAPLQNTPPNPRKPLPDFLAEKPSKAFGRFLYGEGIIILRFTVKEALHLSSRLFIEYTDAWKYLTAIVFRDSIKVCVLSPDMRLRYYLIIAISWVNSSSCCLLRELFTVITLLRQIEAVTFNVRK